jgi:hypothetical protein
MIRAISVLQVSLPGHVDRPMSLKFGPLCSFALCFERLHFDAAYNHGVMRDGSIRIMGKRSVLDVCGNHLLRSRKIEMAGLYSP